MIGKRKTLVSGHSYFFICWTLLLSYLRIILTPLVALRKDKENMMAPYFLTLIHFEHSTTVSFLLHTLDALEYKTGLLTD